MKNKVPEITFAFWLVKISATTLGETGGDALSMTLNLGYEVSTAIFFALFVVAATAQIASKSYRPFLYWLVIIATTTVGTTTSDYLTRTAGLGYPKASLLLFAILAGILAVWRFSVGSVSAARIATHKAEAFYWAAILSSNTLGTALGDALSDTSGFGYGGGALVFLGALVVIALGYALTRTSHTALFWGAFILTRPLGATLGDLLTKPYAQGGLDLSRISSSFALAILMIGCILFACRRPEQPSNGRGDAKPARSGASE